MPAQNLATSSDTENFISPQIEAILQSFLLALTNQDCSNATIRNYRSDIKQFYKFTQSNSLEDLLTKTELVNFVRSQREKGLKDSSIKRKIASINQFALWSKAENLLNQDIKWLAEATVESLLKKEAKTWDAGSDPVGSELGGEGVGAGSDPAGVGVDTDRVGPYKVSQLGRNNVIPKASQDSQRNRDNKASQTPQDSQPKSTFSLKKNFAKLLGSIHTKLSNLTGSINLKRFSIKKTPRFNSTPTPIKPKTITRTIHQRANNFILPYLNLGLILLFFVGLGFLGYNQLIEETPLSLAYPSIPVTPGRVLSFQGRLTDTAQNPITIATDMEFKIWSLLSGGTEGSCDGVNDCEYKTGTCSITPDQDGIFNVGIGDGTCGAEIGANVFSENSSLWLEVKIATETLAPRQPLRTVPFAVNSETVQGYPISATGAATVNTLLVMDAGGWVTLGEVSPSLRSTSGTFTIESETLTLQTIAGSDGDINLDPDGLGGVNITAVTDLAETFTDTTTDDLLNATLTNNTTSGTQNVFYLDNAAGTGTTESILTLDNSDPDTAITSGLLFVDAGGGFTSFIDTPSSVFKVDGSGNTTLANLVATGTTTLNSVAYTWPGADGADGNVLATDGSGTLSWTSVLTDSPSVGAWTHIDHALHPDDYWADDLIIGGNSTASAKFQVFGGTGTASSSGTLSFRGTTDPKIDVLNGENLGFRTSVGGDAGLTERMTILNNGNVGIGTTSPSYTLDVIGDVAGTILRSSSFSGSRIDFRTQYVTDYYTNNIKWLEVAPGSGGLITINPARGDNDFKIWKQAEWTNPSLMVEGSSGNVGIGDTTPASLFTVGNGDLFQVDSTGSIVNIDGVAHSITDTTGDLVLSSNSTNITFNDNVTFAGTTTLNGVAYTWPGADGADGNVLATDGSGTLSWTSVLTDSPSVGAWTHIDHALHPDDYWADDLIIGGNSTASAKFQVFGGTGNITAQGYLTSPGATLSASVAGNVPLTIKAAPSQTANLTEWQNSSGTALTAVDSVGDVIINNSNATGKTRLGQLPIDPRYFGLWGGANATSPSASNYNFMSFSAAGEASTLFNSPVGTGNHGIYFRILNANRMTIHKEGVTVTSLSSLTFPGVTNSEFSIINANAAKKPLAIKAAASQTANLTEWQNSSGTSLLTIDNTGSISMIDGVAHSITDTTGDLVLSSNSTNITFNDNVTFAGTTTLNSVAYTWPGADGADGNVLATDGSGTLSWTSVLTDSPSVGAWTHIDHALHPDDYWADDLIIGGNSTASAKFQVFGGTGNITAQGNLTFAGAQSIIGGTTTTSDLTLQTTTGVGTTGADMHFKVGNNGGTEALTILNNGNVGIGSTSPGAKLDVVGQIYGDSGFSSYTSDGVWNANARPSKITTPGGRDLLFGYSDNGGGTYTPTIGFGITSNAPDSNAGSILSVRAVSGTPESYNRFDINNYGRMQWGAGSAATDTNLFRDSADKLRTNDSLIVDGNVGIGTTTPTSPLHVNAGYSNNALATFNQLNSGDIITASSSGVSKFTIDNTGSISMIDGVAHSITDTTGDLVINSAGTKVTISDDLEILGDDLIMGTNTANYFLMADGANYNPTAPGDARTGLGLTSGGTGDIWVEKAGDTMTGQLLIDLGSDTEGLVIQGDAAQTANLTEWQNSSGTALAVVDENGLIGGGTSSPSYQLDIIDNLVTRQFAGGITRTQTNPSTYHGSLLVREIASQTSSSFGGQIVGAEIGAWLNSDNTQNWTASGAVNQLGLVGLEARNEIRSGAAGTISWIMGQASTADFNNNSTATLTNYAAYKLFQPVNAGSLVGFTNNYGLLIENINAATNNYAIYTNLGDVRFGDDVLIESPSATNKPLTIKAAPSQTANLTEWQNSSGTSLLTIDNTGSISMIDGVAHSITDTAGDLVLSSNSTNITFNDNVTFAGTTTLNGVAYTWPGADGSSGQVLSTNALGTLSWSDAGINYWQLNDGALSPFSLTADVNFGSVATSSAKVSIAGSLDRGLAALIVNQTEDQDILAASSSGITRLKLSNGGTLSANKFADLSNPDFYFDGANSEVSLSLLGKIMAGASGTINGSIAFNLDTTNTLTTALNDQLLTVKNNGVNKFTVGPDGDATFSGSLTVAHTTNPGDLTVNGDILLGSQTEINLNMGTIYDSYVYQTTKDSDYGRWTNNGTAVVSSWYTESLDAEAGKECSLGGTDDRCEQKAFPETAVIIGTSTELIIIDEVTNNLWMRFSVGDGKAIEGTITNIYAKNGQVFVSTNGTGDTGLTVIDFAKDKIIRYDTTGRNTSDQNIAGRNGTHVFATDTSLYHVLRDDLINDFDITTISGITYYALATDAGAYIVKPNSNGVGRDTADGGTATSGTNNTNLAAGAFANDGTTTFWASNNITTADWIQYQYAANDRHYVTSYTLEPNVVYATKLPQDWTLQGSNTCAFAGEEVTLDTVTGQTSWGTEIRTFTVDTPGFYECYRLNMTSNNGGNNLRIEEIQFIEQTETAKYFVDAEDDINNVVLTPGKELIITNETTGALNVFSNAIDDGIAGSVTPDQTLDDSTTLPGVLASPSSTKYALEYLDDEIYYGSSAGVDKFAIVDDLLTKTGVYHNDLVGDLDIFYLMNNTTDALDQTGNNADSSSVNGTPTLIVGPDGEADSALDFDNASNEYFVIPDADVNFFGEIFSMGAWVNKDSGDAADFQYIMGTYLGDGTGAGLSVRTDGSVVFYDDANYLDTGYDLPNDQWVHLVITFSNNNSEITLYVNGEMFAKNIASGAPTDGGDLYIGTIGPVASSTQDFDGGIDEPFGVNRELTAPEVKALYERNLPGQATSFSNATIYSTSTIGTATMSAQVNEFAGDMVEITAGTGAGQYRTIKSNTATTLTTDKNWSTTPSSDSSFRIIKYVMPGVEGITTIDKEGDTLIFGSNDGADGGGAFKFNQDSRYSLTGLQYYNGSAGLTDDSGTAWASTYDDITGVNLLGDFKTFITSDNHYWKEYEGESLLSRLDRVEANSSAGATGVQAVDAEGNIVSNQVIRSGTYTLPQATANATYWATASVAQSQVIPFGITFDNTPVVTTGGGHSARDSGGTYINWYDRAYVSTTNTTSFTYYRYRATQANDGTVTAWLGSFPLSWIAMGTYTQPIGADLAEYYQTYDLETEAGDVVSIDPDNDISVTRSNGEWDQNAIGIVATHPGITLGSADGTTAGVQTSIDGSDIESGKAKAVQVALAGRVPVKVSLENGPIKKGDYLAPASKKGYAMRATEPGLTVGRALEDFDGSSTILDVIAPDVGFSEDELQAYLDKTMAEASASGSINSSDPNKIVYTEGKVMAFVQTGYYQGQSISAADFANYEAADENITQEGKSNSVIASIPNFTKDILERIRKATESTRVLIAEKAQIFTSIFSKEIFTEELRTDFISPLSENGDITLQLGNDLKETNADASGSASLTNRASRINITNASGSAVTSIDSAGNIKTLGDLTLSGDLTTLGDLLAQDASLSGALTASQATISGTLFTKNASVSGQLNTPSARITKLEAKLAQMEAIKAQTAEIVNATISGTLYADDINGFEDKIAQAMKEPSLLEKLIDFSPNKDTIQSFESYLANSKNINTDFDTSSITRLSLSDLDLAENDLVINSQAAFINQYLDVNGSAYIAENLGLGQSLVISDSMFITAGIIDYVPTGIASPTLNIQPSGRGLLSLMAGLLTLDDNGLATITGDLTVTGNLEVKNTLLTNLLSPTDFTSPFQVQLATMSGSILGESNAKEAIESRFEILNELGVAVATISAQGKAEFSSGIGIGSENLSISEASNSAIVESEKTSGTATVGAGSNQIIIKSPLITEKSLIYITPLGSTNNQVLYVKSKLAENPETKEVFEGQFVVGFDSSIASAVDFNWWIVN